MKKMKMLIVVLVTFLSIQAFSQIDTVFTNGKKIPCNVKEITPDAIKYSYVGEDVINSIYITNVQKIIFKSGRIQIFSESKSYKDVSGADDYDKVTLTSLENDIRGLTNLGDLASKAQAGTVFTDMDKVKEKADKRIKIQAAMLGANIIYLTGSKTKGFSAGTKGMSKSMEGIAFSDRLPNFDEFNKLVGSKSFFLANKKIKFSSDDTEFSQKDYLKSLQILKVNNEGGLIILSAILQGVDTQTFRVINFSNTQFTIVWRDGDTFYNFIVNI
jgi:hypothetical protein